MEIIKQHKEKSIKDQIFEMEAPEIKNFDASHKNSVRTAINNLKDREYITSTSKTEEGESYLVVVRLK